MAAGLASSRWQITPLFAISKRHPRLSALAVMMYVRFPLSLRNVEDLLHERGIDISHETFGFGGTGLVRYLLLRSVKGASTRSEIILTGNGTWTRCSCGSMEKLTIYGGL